MIPIDRGDGYPTLATVCQPTSVPVGEWPRSQQGGGDEALTERWKSDRIVRFGLVEGDFNKKKKVGRVRESRFESSVFAQTPSLRTFQDQPRGRTLVTVLRRALGTRMEASAKEPDVWFAFCI